MLIMIEENVVMSVFPCEEKDPFRPDFGSFVAVRVHLVNHDRRARFTMWHRLRLALESPGGKVDRGESPVQAAVRETLEETGLLVSADRFIRRSTLTRTFGDEVAKVITYRVLLNSWELPRVVETAKFGRSYDMDLAYTTWDEVVVYSESVTHPSRGGHHA